MNKFTPFKMTIIYQLHILQLLFPQGSLDLSSQRPEGLDKIKQLESRGHRSREEEVATFQKPVFTTALQVFNLIYNTGFEDVILKWA